MVSIIVMLTLLDDLPYNLVLIKMVDLTMNFINFFFFLVEKPA